MASIRDRILMELVTRIDAIEGMTGTLRDMRNTRPDGPTAYVHPDGEDKELGTSETYEATFRVEVTLVVSVGDADEVTDGGNAYRYLDRMVTEIEKVVHAPDTAGTVPGFSDVVVAGHEIEGPDDKGELGAFIGLTFSYRHHYQDPGL
ncbi:MAG: hypothetical protein ACE37K_11200 [Planctomycetota bacterium]